MTDKPRQRERGGPLARPFPPQTNEVLVDRAEGDEEQELTTSGIRVPSGLRRSAQSGCLVKISIAIC